MKARLLSRAALSLAALQLLHSVPQSPGAEAASFEQRLMAPPMESLYANRLQAESASVLSVNLFDIAIDPAKAKLAATFTIVSPDDPDFAEAKQVRPTSSGSRTRSERVSLRKDLLTKGTHVFLQLPAPMKNGKQYAVKIADLGNASPLPELAAITFDDSRQVNDNIRLNQLGYLPQFAKRAYLGQYMGDAGPMPFDAAEFHVIDAQGKRVFTGKPQRRSAGENLVGQDVYELDFTAFKTPGSYRVHVPGVGVSYAFAIGDDALNPLYANFMRGHYHQRCGHDVDAAFSRHPRAACHLDDAFVEEEATKTKFVDPKNPPLYETKYDGRQQKATGGHHDAGDYGKYTVTGGTYVFAVLHAMSVFPDKFQEDNTGLPYSGNGVPDLLEECKWELDWLENMQDSDGGVFGVIRPRSGGYEHMMPPKEAKRLMFPKDTVFTGAYAAALARAASSPAMRKHYPQDCERYLTKAKKSWEWLQANDRYVKYFHYGQEFGDWDERCWAAIELYAATGEQSYHDYFLKNFDPTKSRWGWLTLFENSGHAVNAYITLKDRKTDDAMLEKCKAALKAKCEEQIRYADAFPYRLSFPEPSARHGNFGWHFPGDASGFELLMGYAMTKDERYLQCALDNMSYTCGANASGYFLHTGLGAKRNIDIVSDYANNDDIIEPIPGIPLGIGSAGFYGLAKYGPKIAEGTYPKDWPLVNRWYDGFNVSTEFTMGPMMRETIVAAYFASMPKGAAKKPTVKITADKLAGPAPLTVNFNIETEAKVRQVFWDFGDETFSTRATPTKLFADPGHQYPIAVSIVDENGQWATASVQVTCQITDAKFSQSEHTADANTLALYHFNGDLKDAAGKAPELQPQVKKPERQAHKFAPDAPAWMKSPSGSCLVLDGAEHFTVTLPPVENLATTPISAEMMLYVREFTGWSYEGNPQLLGLANDWDSQLSWSQGTWDKENAPAFGKAIGSAKFAKEFPRNRWCHVKLIYDGKGASTFAVDGEVWGTMEGQPFKPNLNQKPLKLSVGPFRGMVDEVRVQVGEAK